MKKSKVLLCVAICLSAFVACGPEPTSYIINGQVEGLPDGTVVELLPVSYNDEPSVGEAVVKDGKFVFSGVADMVDPLAVYLHIAETYAIYPMILENGNITITAKVISVDGVYDFESVTVKGSPMTKKYNKLLSVRNGFDKMYNDYHIRHKETIEKHSALLSDEGEIIDEAAYNAFLESPEYKAFEEAEMEFFDAVGKAYNDVIVKNKDTFWGPLLMITLYSYSTEENQAEYDAFSEEAKASRYGKIIKESVYPTGLKFAPYFTIKDESGQEFTLSQLCEGKKYILIDFWASWCNPCRKEIPNLKELYKTYSVKGFEIISLSMDQQPEAWKKALLEESMPWPNFLDTENIANEYKVKYIPATYLIDNVGNVVAQDIRSEELSAKLAELFQ